MESDCIDQITIRNTGSITTVIKSIYLDNEFLFDASNATLNPLGNIISPNSTKAISFQGIANENRTYQPNSTITVVTDRGTRSIALQQTLASYTDSQLIVQTNFGPLKLDFKEFYCATYDLGVVGSWQPGWSISKTINKGVIWKVNVTNICNTAISLKNNTCFFLMAVSPANLREWYLNSTSTITLDPSQTQTLTFIWKTPNGGGVNSIFSTACTCRVFMAFFGTYETEKPLSSNYTLSISKCLLGEKSMKLKIAKNKKGLTSVFLAVFLVIIIISLTASLFASIRISATTSLQVLDQEQQKQQEAIFLEIGAITFSDNIIQEISVKNTGSIPVVISAIYIDKEFLRNPELLIKPLETGDIDLSDLGLSYSENLFNTLMVTTERGTKLSVVIKDLEETDPNSVETIYGPIRLLFEEFHWANFQLGL